MVISLSSLVSLYEHEAIHASTPIEQACIGPRAASFRLTQRVRAMPRVRRRGRNECLDHDSDVVDGAGVASH
jgi:hypothetical protein